MKSMLHDFEQHFRRDFTYEIEHNFYNGR